MTHKRKLQLNQELQFQQLFQQAIMVFAQQFQYLTQCFSPSNYFYFQMQLESRGQDLTGVIQVTFGMTFEKKLKALHTQDEIVKNNTFLQFNFQNIYKKGFNLIENKAKKKHSPTSNLHRSPSGFENPIQFAGRAFHLLLKDASAVRKAPETFVGDLKSIFAKSISQDAISFSTMIQSLRSSPREIAPTGVVSRENGALGLIRDFTIFRLLAKACFAIQV
eukprot:TRINITY_DN1969_c2_g3_i1.p2 TRINITY_DN1969_c2_g3~~TRINITY_DN1969_c2_g3_i1.p2  ORF type:complete len:220 (-),score=8.94 TRINITY_DN1969_c2_g3_i1:592-1251(-)